MKRIIIFTFMFLISLSLISCKNDKTNNSLEKVLEFVNDSGEKIIIDELCG